MITWLSKATILLLIHRHHNLKYLTKMWQEWWDSEAFSSAMSPGLWLTAPGALIAQNKYSPEYDNDNKEWIIPI